MGAACCCPIPAIPGFAWLFHPEPNGEVVCDEPKVEFVDEPKPEFVDEPKVELVDEPKVEFVDEPKEGVVEVPKAGVVVAGFAAFPNPLNENPPVLILNDNPTRDSSPYLWRNRYSKKCPKNGEFSSFQESMIPFILIKESFIISIEECPKKVCVC